MTSSTRKITLILVLALVAGHAVNVNAAAINKDKRLRIVPDRQVKKFTSAIPAVPLPETGNRAPADVAKAFAAAAFKVAPREILVKDVVTTSSGVTSVHLRQLVNGLEVTNANANINVDKDGKIISYGDSFFRGARPPRPPVTNAESSAEAGPAKSPEDGFKALAAKVGLALPKPVTVTERTAEAPGSARTYEIKTDAALSPVPVKFAYVQKGDKLELVYQYQVELKGAWYNGHVSAATGAVEALVDWTADASYTALPFGANNPDETPVRAIDVSASAINKAASPLGWHDQGNGKSFTDTRGNNVYAQENIRGREDSSWRTNKRPDGGKALQFNAKPDFGKDPSTYTAAATTQLFYLINNIHDIAYQYGFDEKSGNFQENNFGKGGRGNDAVIANAQDGADTNNADFGTPPDGQKPKMRMFIFTETNPKRDGVFDSSIPSHEFFHGVSTRLVGGPSNSDCLDTLEAGGMGEGWSDVAALMFNAKRTDTRSTPRPMGAYVVNNPAGIRTYPYSTSLKTNPSTYSFLARREYKEVHMIGEVWAATLFEVYWNLVDKLGFSADLLNDSKSGKGNTVFFQILLDAMKLTPCSPSFVDARDAFIQAEKALTGGKHQCDVWAGFAKRGLGVNAANYRDDLSVPAECQ
ncbi:hypothetical protein H9P43_002181 [Blastocladiella emersonii ATCC 22665]|nr:hypothetical protein H9P43_002167 [Blastocladiella emersonii ATCC 22665]KAI9187790.1 hypothetical protein H9P43_002181 [Blastocladiella emersonii ATCC 22665]